MTSNYKSNFISDFSAGRAFRAYEHLGAHPLGNDYVFRVWAPGAVFVSLAGDFNDWSPKATPMKKVGGGIWEIVMPGLSGPHSYKYCIGSKDGQTLWKCDPYGFYSELRPASASRLFDISGFRWTDGNWLTRRQEKKIYDHPLNIYEVHLGSWKNDSDGNITYRKAAKELIPYVKKMGFTHVEFLPLTEHPYDASWGYQCTGYFAATSRYGTPHDLMYLINACHRAGIGIIMDWVPAHFPKDPHGLVEFDGTRLYENTDPQMAEHPSWGTRIFDYGRGQVRSFLISSALFWLEKYHIDGLRVDAVASMLYLDYDRKDGSWRRNELGGNENLRAVEFLRELNSACFSHDDSIMMIAEESTAWPMVTAPVDAGGLGFNLKWNMGWMNDTLHYLKTDPLFRNGCHRDLTFSLMYAFSENFVLPLSHDEVVHMKGSLMGKIPGSHSQKIATVRTFWAYMLAHPGKKLLFMGPELGQESEWDFESQLPWELLEQPENEELHRFFQEINRFYSKNSPLWDLDFSSKGFSWICPDDKDRNVLSFIRKDRDGRELIFLCSFSGSGWEEFRLGVPGGGTYRVVFSTDDKDLGGNGEISKKDVFRSKKLPCHGYEHSIVLDLPPLTGIFLKRNQPRKIETPLEG